MATLTQAWTDASAALPLGWRLEALLLVEDERWQAIAADERGRQFGNAAGNGSYPAQALLDLAVQLRRIRGNPNG